VIRITVLTEQEAQADADAAADVITDAVLGRLNSELATLGLPEAFLLDLARKTTIDIAAALNTAGYDLMRRD
jgi:hypothetical protein